MQIKHRHISGEMPLSVLIHAAKVRALEQMGRFRENALRSVTHDVIRSGKCTHRVRMRKAQSNSRRAFQISSGPWLVCWRPHRRVLQ